MKSVHDLQLMRKIIEKMSKFHHIEILKMMKESKVNISENNYGAFINMTELNEDTIAKLENYIQYTEEQEIQLKDIEREKGLLKYKFFSTSSSGNASDASDLSMGVI